MKNGLLSKAVLCVAVVSAAVYADDKVIDLAGTWRFAIDRENAGQQNKWFAGELVGGDTVKLPGSLQEQGFGDRPSAQTEWTVGIGKPLLENPRFKEYLHGEEFLSPFWLTPMRHYVGQAWYQKTVSIPQNWAGKRMVLFLERPHWQTAIWVDDKQAGSRDSLGTAHLYDLTALLKPGDNRLTICVDNRVVVPVGYDAHSVSDQTQSNWNGIVGKIELQAQERLWIEDVGVFPDVANHKIRVVVEPAGVWGKDAEGSLSVRAGSFNSSASHNPQGRQIKVSGKSGDKIEFDYPMGEDALLWDEFSPNLYRLNLELSVHKGREDFAAKREIVFGMRELGVSGTQFTINGRKIFLRGTLECCIFPLTGYPPTDVESWKKILHTCRAYGLNHIRFHSWCPPEAAFAAADEIGFYYQVEASCWASFGSGSAVDKWVYEEADRMLKAYGNHPSFIMMAASNEPAGDVKKRDEFLGQWVKHCFQKDPRRRYTAGSGWPQIPENNYHVNHEPRLENYKGLGLAYPPQTFDDYGEVVNKYSVPFVSHEIGQWCVYPNIAEMHKYSGVMRGGNIEIARDRLAKAGMEQLGQDFLLASGKFQALLYKQEIEAALRTPGFGGFALLDLHDFPGHGTAPVGVLDCFWESKGYINSEQYSRFCGPTVPLARLKQLVFTNDMVFNAIIDVAHYGRSDVSVQPAWCVRDSLGNVLLQGRLGNAVLKTGGLTRLGEITFSLKDFTRAQKLNLEVSLENVSLANDWNFWVYPAKLDLSGEKDIYFTEIFDDKAVEILKQGGRVLLTPQPDRLKADTVGAFQPIFWNRVIFSWKEHTLGILTDPRHPALADFPTDFYTNWQWHDLLQRSKPVVLDDLDKSIQPIVRVIDDWNICRSLAIVFEVNVEKGKLLVCSTNLSENLSERPVARQLRRSLEKYMMSENFRPGKNVSVEAFRKLFKEPSPMQRLGAKVIHTSSAETQNEGSNVLDENPATIWHSAWSPKPVEYPHEISIELNRVIQIAGFTCLPRQDGNRNGWINEYEFYVSNDGKDWGKPAAKGSFSRDASLKKVVLESPLAGRFIRFVALKGFDNDPYSSLAELEIIQKQGE